MTKENDPDIGRTLAAAGDPDMTLNPQQAQKLRSIGAELHAGIADLTADLSEPMKGRFAAIDTEITRAIASLPSNDRTPVADQSAAIDLLSGAQNVINSLAEVAKAARQEIATVRASVTTEVEKAIAVKISSGELLTKDASTKAVTTAAETAKESVRKEQKILGDRTRAVASLNLPSTPSDEVLAGKDEDFNAKSDRAKARAEKLKGFTVASATLSKLVWASSDSDFNDAVDLLNANKPAASGANPFAAPGAPAVADAKTEFRKKAGCI
jgi:hypothetical protein